MHFPIILVLPKNNKFFTFFHLAQAVQSLLHNAPRWNREIEKIQLTQIFYFKTMFISLKYVFYIKDLLFWGISCLYSSETIKMVRGAYLAKPAIIAPLPFSYSLSYMNAMYLKRTDLHVELSLQ